ncbi:hypothetical protein [uncultured Gimesia sp.]|uniref:hypothetical protein n=1 Tax=uncultured Gimesia sp. TaxID=1678688 RepID=UPI0030D88153
MTKTASNDTLMTLTTVPTELEGQLLVQLLEEHGIPATASGGMTSEFRAEAPGVVQVMVLQDRFSDARSIIEKQEASNSQSRAVDQDQDASDYVPGLTKFGFWTLIIGNIVALIAILAWL